MNTYPEIVCPSTDMLTQGRFFVEGAHDILSYGYTGSSFEQPSTAKESSSSPLSLGSTSAALGTVLSGLVVARSIMGG